MDDGKYNDWFNKNYDNNLNAFVEKMSDEFDDFCFQRFISPKEVDYEPEN